LLFDAHKNGTEMTRLWRDFCQWSHLVFYTDKGTQPQFKKSLPLDDYYDLMKIKVQKTKPNIADHIFHLQEHLIYIFLMVLF
jgi:hypothetical protein